MEDKKTLSRGNNSKAIATACLLLSCRCEGETSRTIKEFELVSQIESKKIGKAIKEAQKTLNLNINPVKDVNFISRYCSNLNLSTMIQNFAEEVSINIDKEGVASGRNPITVASASIFIVCYFLNEKTTIKDIADVTGIGEPTIKSFFLKRLNL